MLNNTCPKCQQRVTERDHADRNVEPALTLTGPPDPAQIRGQVGWQHRACPR